MKEADRTEIRISVRNLVEFVFRSGNIDNRIGKGKVREAMQEGSRMHRRIQKKAGRNYQAEVALKLRLDRGEYALLLEGRADGIITSGNSDVTVDEIKCMYTDVSEMEEPVAVHRAQAMCYAYMYALQHDLETIGIQMIYCDLDTEEIHRFKESVTFASLQEWFDDMMDRYWKWADFQYHWKQIRQQSIHQTGFPYPYRSGQKKLVRDVYLSIAREKVLFLQAPTGTGKTLSTVFPAVKAVGENLADTVFYLTAKTVTRMAALHAFDLLAKEGYRGKVIVLTAKEKMCPLDEMDCNPDGCPFAEGHFDRVNDAVYELIRTQDRLTADVLLQQAKKWKVCPFEMSLDTASWCDDIICDYNYVFDPNVYLKRFFGEGVQGRYLFLVDEAHNLVERGRRMYSADLIKEDFLAVRKACRSDARLSRQLLACNRQMLEWKRECDGRHTYESIGPFQYQLLRLGSLLDQFLQKNGGTQKSEEVTDFYLNLRHFLNMLELSDENYVIYTDFDDAGRFCLHLYCVNPSENLQHCLDRAVSCIFFSATLLPVNYYKQMLCCRTDTYAVYARTVFTPDQRFLAIGKDVSSLYKRRNRKEYLRFAEYIRITERSRTGNYLVFFPSYHMMAKVYDAFLSLCLPEEAECICQKSHMTEEERDLFLQKFSGPRSRSLIGFCVMGGIFSEGIDLKAEQLIGVLIIGTGIPQICNERDILKEYYDRHGGCGFEYAYQYPGMNKVLQAAGRLLRTSSDAGVIELLDERFLRSDYRRLFPREWTDGRVCTLQTIEEPIREFWKRREKIITDTKSLSS